MKQKMDIMTNTVFWTILANRYFDAECSEAEEALLKRFVASKFSYDDIFSTDAIHLFREARATMSLICAGRMDYKLNMTSTIPTPLSSDSHRSNGRMWRWVVTGAAAGIVGVTFLITQSGSTENEDVCLAYVNGEVITEREKVMEIIRDSWNDIDIESGGVGRVESQLKDMFDVLE